MVLASVNNTYKFNYVINHLVYEKSSITKLLDANNPKDPLVQVTLVREPIQQLRSSFNYYQILKPDGEESKYDIQPSRSHPHMTSPNELTHKII